MLKILVGVLILVPIFFYSLFLILLYQFQEKLIFPGTKLPEDYRFEFTLPFKELTIPVDGAEINALHFHQENPRGLVFFLHGNGGNLVDWTTHVDFYQKVNYDLFIFDYRGYGKSTGKIQSQEQLLEDVRTLWQSISPQYKAKPIVIYGRSLGTALATQLAIEESPELLILVSPFTSIKTLAKENYPIAPSALLRYPLETDAIIKNVSSDTVFIHGDKDRSIPISHSQNLYGITQAKKELITIEGAGHNDIHDFDKYYKELARRLPD